jgi:hypothetical protein
VAAIPIRVNKRLLFATCRTCATRYTKGVRDPEYNCPHFDEQQRGFSATLTHPELKMALTAGYKVTRLYRTLQWEETELRNDIFKPYMRKFMKIKYEVFSKNKLSKF